MLMVIQQSTGNRFVEVAIQHGLLGQHHADKILDHARDHDVQPSDAALTLSMLQLHEVDAINLLCDPEQLMPGYELTGLIGCGAGGMVFRAHQTALGRDVALKTIHQSSTNAKTIGQSRIQRESHAIAKLRHPGIVAAYDSGFHQGRFCIAMELVDGINLADYIHRESSLPESVTWQIVRQVASALSNASAAGIIHRDVKPANLLLCETPIGIDLPPGVPFVKVADFGLAFTHDEGTQITATGTTLGTPAYVAPEQLQDTHVDARADIYSLGATAFHMLSGDAPCVDQSPMRTIMQKSIGDDRWRETLPDWLSPQTVSLFRDMTEASPDARIADHATLIQRIDELLDQPFDAAGREASNPTLILEPKPDAASLKRRHIVPAALSSMAVLMTVLLVALVVHLFDKSSQQTITHTSAPEQDVRWMVDGFPRPLFNGSSVPLFRQSGNWSVGTVEDGGRVLVGRSSARMTVPLSMDRSGTRNVRLRLGLHLENNSAAELRLAFSDSSSEQALLRFQDGVVDFILSSADDRETKSIQLPGSSHDDAAFQRITIQRRGDQADLTINGELLGTVQCNPTSEASFQIRCISGVANFADIDIVPLAPEVGS
ncbi:MAG: serine/threonine-protein kinase [Planctomycetota bacterium]